MDWLLALMQNILDISIHNEAGYNLTLILGDEHSGGMCYHNSSNDEKI